MQRSNQSIRLSFFVVLIGFVFAVASCGSDEPTSAEGGETDDASGSDATSTDDGGGLPNACPAEGCTVFITGAEPSEGGELQLTFDANFTPDFERNHIHVFWDTQEPGAVSSDFEAKGFDTQGKWHPTDEYPSYVTQSDASVTSDSRGESSVVCVTAADGDHAVLDAALFACKDVGDALG